MFGKRGSLFWMNMHSMHAEIHAGEMAPGSFLQQDSLKIDDSIIQSRWFQGTHAEGKVVKARYGRISWSFGRLPTACCHVQHICWLWTCQTNMHPFGFNHDETEMQSLMFRLHFLSFLLADLSVTTPPGSLESFRWQYWVCVTPLMWMY